MARPIQIDVKRVAQARRTVKATRNLDDFKSALAVLLPAQVGLTLDETARLLGVGTASVNRMQARVQLGRTSLLERRNWGGRRQALLTPQEEIEFLQPWAEQAQSRPRTQGCWSSRRFARPWRSVWAIQSKPRWFGDCWRDTGGAKWRPTPSIPRMI
jgi:hypothetical protein